MENDNNLEVLTTILRALRELDTDAQKRTLQAVMTFLGIPLVSNDLSNVKITESNKKSKSDVSFSENREMASEEFLLDKMPSTDIEKIVCLAYYLTHYRNTPRFKTLDLSSLNTEAAQPKFSNAENAVNGAIKAGLLEQLVNGSKQLSSAGELYVQALPNRDAAKASITNIKTRTLRKPLVKKAKLNN